MKQRAVRRGRRVVGLAVGMAALVPVVAQADDDGRARPPVTDHEFAPPVFGIDATADGVWVADGSGIVAVAADGTATQYAEGPGIADVLAGNGGAVFALTGGGPPAEGDVQPRRLYSVDSDGTFTEIANLGRFERRRNPDGGEIDSNPYHLAQGGRVIYVADAGANAVLAVRPNGRIRVVAVLPEEKVSTAPIKEIAGCGTDEVVEDLAFVCEFPARVPAQAVATGVVVGSDGAIYVSELKGFPAVSEQSRIWRIEPGTRGADCADDERCSVVGDGFTSIVDLAITAEEQLVVTEIDLGGFLAVESGGGIGGRVQLCDPTTGECTEVDSGIPLPTATDVQGDSLVGITHALTPKPRLVSYE